MKNSFLSHVWIRGVMLSLSMATAIASGQGLGPAIRSQDKAPPQQPPPTTQRPTSNPYTGDLSIFEYPDRDKKLPVDRVMDLLGITAGKTVADVSAVAGG